MTSKTATDPLLPSKKSDQVVTSAKVEPLVVVRVNGFADRKQALAIQDMFLGWFPKGIRVVLESVFRASTIKIYVNDQLRITQTHAKMVDADEDPTRLWPMEKSKIRADMRGWMEDSEKESMRREVPSQRDSSQDALVTPVACNTIGALVVVASMFLIIYLLVMWLARGFNKEGSDDDASAFPSASHEEL